MSRKELCGEALTEREREIISYVAQGWGNRDIGDMTFISERTVRTHMHNILSKLGASNRTDAARIAREVGLIDNRGQLARRYSHRNGSYEPPEETGCFWMHLDESDEFDFFELAKAPWGEWRNRRLGKDWELYNPDALRALGARFWGPAVAPWDNE